MSTTNLLTRGLSVIENLSALGSLSTEQLAAKTGIPKSSVYRILRILEESNYVSRLKVDMEDFWSLDLNFLALSANILGRVDLKTEIRDILVKLADDTMEIVQLAVFRNGKVLIVDNIKKYSSLVSVAHEGTSLCINCCAAGLVFGAHMDSAELDAVLKTSDLAKRTGYTITDPDVLRKQFELIRARGYAIDDQYYAIGHRCIGAPVFDHMGKVIAEINISGHMQTLSDDKIHDFAEKVMRRADEASRRMGFVARTVKSPEGKETAIRQAL